VVLVDRLVASDDDDEEDPGRTHPVFLCPFCGALHPEELSRCDGCGREGKLVRLLAVEDRDKHPPGYLISCLSCKTSGYSWGSQYREPARPVRAVTVSDVHVLAQNMIQHADRRRLLVFADNRQDAAFQSGWMRDHARRFRIRALMVDYFKDRPISVGDLVARLDEFLENDDDASRSLIPEVWLVARKESAGIEHAGQRKRFLRILVLREITTGLKQRVGLEPWGRLLVDYQGLSPELPLIQEWSARLEVDPERLRDGVAAILDTQRRNMLLHDAEGLIFSRFWMDGDFEVQRGYLPRLNGVPKGLKLQRAPDDDRSRVSQWLSPKGDTLVRKAARAFGVEKDEAEDFVRSLWVTLADELELLIPVTLLGAKRRPLPHCSGVRQIDADRLLLHPHRGRWRCTKCQRLQVRPTPHDRCLSWRCDGTLAFEEDDPDNYDLAALDGGFTLLRPAEHTAQVPNEERERLEHLFKGKGEAVNTLVCTPTLELGVDIGGLDTVLLRNVPPLPANYWQRVGRAGRRHRLAVNLTYARPASHDRSYFADPSKLLEGRVEPPRFNMKNELMLGKHVRAAVITHLHHLAREGSGLSAGERGEIQ
ncbi:MAG: helicase-related protein, partial [Acidobacteriota bacterium]